MHLRADATSSAPAGSFPAGSGEVSAAGAIVLAVRGLSLDLVGAEGTVAVTREVDLELRRGEVLGLVGESGSGKSLTALAVMRLLPPAIRVVGGQVWLGEEDLFAASERRMCAVRGGRIGWIPQEPGSALNPVLTIGAQLIEAIRLHRPLGRAAAREEAERLLRLVAMPDPGQRLRSYPHQLSGGQRQRVMIAIALAGEPEVLLADEPTTALDVTLQAEVLGLLGDLQRTLGLAILLVTHDLAVVAEVADRVAVMYAGRVVESGAASELFADPLHPYTRALLASIPRLGVGDGGGGRRLPTIPGAVPLPGAWPAGCAFHPRCAEVRERCRRDPPPLVAVGAGRRARCVLLAPAAAAERSP